MATPIRATYRVQLARRLRLRRRGRARRLPRRARRQPPLQLALPAGGAGQHARLRRRRPRSASTTSSAAPRATRAGAPRCARTGSGRCSTSCPTTWRSPAPTTPGGGTCSRTGRPSRYARHFDVDWDPPETKLRNTRAGADARPTTTAACSRPASCGSRATAIASSSATHEHVLPVAPRSLDELLARRRRALRLGRPGLPRRRLRRACRWRPRPTVASMAAAPSRQGVAARAAGAPARRAARGGRGDRRRGRRDQRRRRRAATRCSSARTTGWPSGAPPRASSATGASSTSTRWSACASRTSAVFADTHALVLRWLADGTLDGVRIDHPDGLRDPEAYLQRLRARGAAGVDRGREDPRSRASGCARRGRSTAPPATTSCTRVGGLFVDPGRRRAADRLLRRVHRASRPTTRRSSREKKHQVHARGAGSDVNRLTALLVEVCERHRRHRDYTRHELHEALRELIACFPVYRTYVQRRARRAARRRRARRSAAPPRPPRRGGPTSTRRCSTSCATCCCCAAAGRRRGASSPCASSSSRGPVMAKGVEDTAFYCFNRLVALNEVGGDPGRFGVGVDAFHAACIAAQVALAAHACSPPRRTTPSAARTCARAWRCSRRFPARWEAGVRRWAALNERHRRDGLPDRNDRVPLLPDARRRLAARRPSAPSPTWRRRRARPRLHTSWTAARTQRYEAALRELRRPARSPMPAFPPTLEAFVAPLIAPARITSLAQTLIKLHRAGRSRPLPGHRAVGPEPGRSGQPPPGRLRAAPPAARSARRR